MENKETYIAPEMVAIELMSHSIMATSGEQTTVSDPWKNLNEEEW